MSGRWNQSGVACEVRSGTSDRCCAAGGSRGSLSERSRLKIEREGRGDWGRQFATVAGLLAAVYRDGRWLYSCSRLNQRPSWPPSLSFSPEGDCENRAGSGFASRPGRASASNMTRVLQTGYPTPNTHSTLLPPVPVTPKHYPPAAYPPSYPLLNPSQHRPSWISPRRSPTSSARHRTLPTPRPPRPGRST